MTNTDDRIGMDGVDYLSEVMHGKRRQASFERMLNYRFTGVSKGAIAILAEPLDSFANPMNTLHGGYFAGLLDTAMSASVHSALNAGQDFTTVELKVNFMKAQRLPFTKIHARGTVRKIGQRVAFAEGEIYSETNELLASGSTTCLIWHHAGIGKTANTKPATTSDMKA